VRKKPDNMKFLFLLLPVILISCKNPRVSRLEEENAALRSRIDSMNSQKEVMVRRSEEMVLKASIRAKIAYDSVIVAQNMKVIRVNEACGTETLGALLRSMEEFEQKLEELGIQVIYTKITGCGYELRLGSHEKIIEGALTAENLAGEIEEFYRIKISE